MSRFMRLVFWFVGLNALAGAAALMLFPAHTGTLFFWTIRPAINAALFGALYLGGGVVVGLLAIRGRWEPARFLVPVLVVAGILISIVTLIHIDAFQRGLRLAYWLIVYIGAPLLAGAIYLQHERGGADWTIRVPLAPSTRRLAVTLGAAVLAAGLIILIRPAPVVAGWPWATTPLMTRIFAAWFSAFGAGLLWFHVDRDWGRLRQVPNLLIAAAGLDLLLLLAHHGDVAATGPQWWLYCAHLLGIGLLGGVMHWLQWRYAQTLDTKSG
jgi:hypothetical protein